jgi:hypothetical protein
VRLRVASCSRTRRRVDVSVVVVTLRVCVACEPGLLSVVEARIRSVAALAGRDCCWRRAAEARLSATEAPRDGGLEAIARCPHSKPLESSASVCVSPPSNDFAHGMLDLFTWCDLRGTRAKQKARIECGCCRGLAQSRMVSRARRHRSSAWRRRH